ncbi:hypothetical protein BSL78_23738 [Apostichopus japonicus]|uniref:Mitochondrial import inner membrane translocase subunit TIM50 n=1 Tax=Stichopus japonicus TaxID=307972 RepID=A0A2G8JUH4_STIJA|nr:hypothetical protein BSL78_23738 [Apostichopus japonicus]
MLTSVPSIHPYLVMVSQWYDLVVFTASMEIYGSPVVERLDNGRGILNRRYYRQHCKPDSGYYAKDLSAVNSDLSSIFIVDNSPSAYRLYPDKAYQSYRGCPMRLTSTFSVYYRFSTLSGLPAT